MCCFSRRVDKVADTSIFARPSKDNKQFLVYSMIFAAKEDLAMILPLPTPKGSAEDALRFINLEKYPDFFKDMAAGFPAPPPPRGGGDKSGDSKPDHKPLVVVDVGSFEASFVPAVKDFSRLDERFRLPADTWDSLPAYKVHGFAVFKLKSGEKAKKVHPMAFEFPRADKSQLFFPTVHIHDGKVHKTATFDHALYCQGIPAMQLMRWTESPKLAGSFMKIDETQGLIDKDGHVYRLRLSGRRNNEDILV
jgi:hypothetical protein